MELQRQRRLSQIRPSSAPRGVAPKAPAVPLLSARRAALAPTEPLEFDGLRAIAVAPVLSSDFSVQIMQTRMFKQVGSPAG